MKCPLVPISIGELIDKITILQIKSEYTGNQYVHKELQDLSKIAQDLGVYKKEYLDRLLEVNRKLWVIEDEIRVYEDKWLFNDDFIRLARTVYITNDERAEIKKKINIETKSTYQEVKLY
jgi:hypothetical protein